MRSAEPEKTAEETAAEDRLAAFREGLEALEEGLRRGGLLPERPRPALRLVKGGEDGAS